MKTLSLSTGASGGGQSLAYTCTAPNLENKLLSQTSTLLQPPNNNNASPLLTLSSQSLLCPSLQPSLLSSTTSKLLSQTLPPSSLLCTLPSSSSLLCTLPSSSSLLCALPSSSSLLCTQNKLLNTDSPLISVPQPSAVSAALPGSSVLNRFVHGAVKKTDGEAQSRDTPSPMCCAGEDTTVHYSEDEVDMSEEESSMFVEEEESTSAIFESPDMEEEEVAPEESEVITLEFEEVKRNEKDREEMIKDNKYLLLNLVCCSLVNKSTSPGQKDWNSEDSVWTKVINLGRDISEQDPEFLLKVAVYTRQELNIRITANFLLALAANLTSAKCHVRRYFCAAVQLPSDWLEVVRIYSTCFSRSLPMCLKKGLTDKFKQFSEYQLAKYNTRKHRCKHNRNRSKAKKNPSDQELRRWANLLRSEPDAVRKLSNAKTQVVEKKQSEFSLKKMIRKLHIKDPAEYVMAILGRKYPSDAKAFTRSGIKGTWDRDRAGKRMKLKEPETWERLLCQEGNKAATWEKLIDNNSLPFMAMLRNLRNMIKTGISEAHHRQILGKLTNKKAVIQSRQFPIRFLAAYKVIMELQTLTAAAAEAVPSRQNILKEILKKIPKSRRFRSLEWDKTPKSRLRCTLSVPLVYRLYKTKRAQLLSAASRKTYSVELLQRYRDALEKAVQISCRYNIPPLPGKTVVLLNPNMTYSRSSEDFCLPPDPNPPQGEEGDKGKAPGNSPSPTLLELGALLSLMIGSSAEDFSLVLTHYDNWTLVKLESDVLLENVRAVTKRIKKFGRMTCEEREEDKKKSDIFSFSEQNKVDNVIVVSDYIDYGAERAVNIYRKDVNTKALVIKIVLDSNFRAGQHDTDRNCVLLTGFSEQVLRFVAERGSSRLLDHVEHLDKVYNIPPPEGTKEPLRDSAAVSIPASPSMRWRGVRVFISSTFRDMHSERDILVRSVFPELRRRAAPHRLYLQEVELRWGVTEEESGRAVELCLNEVCRSQMMVLLLGERYGLTPPKPQLPELPQYSWLSSAPEGLSVTEMEIRQFEAHNPNAAERMFCYFRDPDIAKSVPVAWRGDFAPESREAESKMAALKNRLRESEARVTEDYPSEWGGVVDGKPYLKNLEFFHKTVLEELWAAVKEHFIESADESAVSSEESEQEVHQELLYRQFFGRSKLLSSAVTLVEQAQTRGGLLLLEGGAGEGKTVFMAALGHALKTTKMKPKHEARSYSAAASQSARSGDKTTRDVVSYSTSASQSARSVEILLRFLIQGLRKNNETKDETPLPRSYQDLVTEFHFVLSRMNKNAPLVILVDGVDLLQDGSGHIISDWIPQHLPQGVCLVLSVPTSSSLLQTLVKKKAALLFTLAPLTMNDRKEIVQKRLDAFGKKLSDSAFNNQVQTLIMKKGAVSPLYLHLACEDLRNFASFDKLKDSLQMLPQSLPQLVQFSLDRLCSEFRQIQGLRWALAALTLSSTGLKERELYAVLNICNDLYQTQGALSWDSALDLSRKPRGRVPMANFTRIVHSLQSLIGPSNCSDTNDLVVLSNPEVRRAFGEFFLPTETDRSRASLILAAHLWTSADPMGADTFLHCEASALLQLPHCLIQSNQKDPLKSVLSSYYFVFANVRHGLLHHLLQIYNSFNSSDEAVVDCLTFLEHHSSLLSSWPALFIQQALNESPKSSAHIWAQSMMGKGGVRAIKWLNNTENNLNTGTLVSSFSSEPSCLVLSPDGQMMVVGTGRGTLHFIHTQTGQEVRSLVSSCDGVSSCVFVTDGHLASTSFDGKIEMWDVENGCRTAIVAGHKNAITGSDLSADRKQLATVSLDSVLKVWSASKGEQVAFMHSTRPMNCVTFDPEGHALAVGCWNGNITVWNWLQNTTIASLVGHGRSVHSVAFSSSSLLCSGSVSGEVRVWSVFGASCVGCFQAHAGSTEALTFIDDGRKLLTAGADHMLQLWSGGLGRSVTTLKTDKFVCEPPQKRRRAPPTDSALCVCVSGDTAAVGTKESIKLFTVDSGEKIWTSEDLPSSVHCLLWVFVDQDQNQDQNQEQSQDQNQDQNQEQSQDQSQDQNQDQSQDQSQDQNQSRSKSELLVSGGQDRLVRVWRECDEEEGQMGGLEMAAVLDSHQGPVLALAKNDTYLATASDDCSVALWLLSSLLSSVPPHSILRAHSRGVTCLSFSPEGDQLLSGGKDQALILWDVSSTPVLSKSLLHCHRDWITGCAWTTDCVVSSSNDGRLCFWDLIMGKSIKEISWKNPLTSVCCQGPYVVAGCSEGGLHVWKWDSAVEICHISAHTQSIHHCALFTDAKESNPEDLTVVTASEDGTAKVWKPLQVEHCSSFMGHTGTIRGVVPKKATAELLTVSEDGSVRCWDWNMEFPPFRKASVTALCFCQRNALLISAFESGLLEFWIGGHMVGHKQVSKGPVTALCSMPDGLIAVGYREPRVDVFKLVWTQSGSVSLVKVKSHMVEDGVICLTFCSSLLGVCPNGCIQNVSCQDEKSPWMSQINDWNNIRFLSLIPNDGKSAWLIGEETGALKLGFVFSLGPNCESKQTFAHLKLHSDEGALVTAATVHNDFLVCGDVKGNMWFNLPPDTSSWSDRKPAHTDRITVLRLTEDNIISASLDKTVKIWDRRTKKQVGMFVCGAPVLRLEIDPEDQTKLVCGDRLGNVYFLSWTR